MLTLLDKYTREYLNIDIARKINATDVVERLADLFVFPDILSISVQTTTLNLS